MNQINQIKMMIFITAATLFVVILFGSGTAAAQSAPRPVSAAGSLEQKRQSLDKLAQMIGEWEGTGWVQMGAQRAEFRGFERVQKKIGGLALLVEGKFSDEQGRTVHETLAVLTFDVKKNGYLFKTYLASGTTGESDFEIVPGGWRWSVDTPNGTMRYTTEMTADTWKEIGELSRPGGEWTKFFEMNLARVKNAAQR